MLFPYIVMKLMEIASLIVFLAFFYGGLCIKIATFPEGKDDTSGSTTCSCSTGDIITGAVLSVACEGSIFPKVKEEMKHSNVCTEEFRWHIPSGWCSPVDLLFNLTVPMIRKPRARRITEVELNLTRGGWQIAKVRWDENLLNEENMRYVTKVGGIGIKYTYKTRLTSWCSVLNLGPHTPKVRVGAKHPSLHNANTCEPCECAVVKGQTRSQKIQLNV
uniref:DA-P36 family member n=1 Tax=Rhipicephalus zambeziensis TaxID=60191 RepID=A0A224Y7V9_9ACAR